MPTLTRRKPFSRPKNRSKRAVPGVRTLKEALLAASDATKADAEEAALINAIARAAAASLAP
jgi:hypothetical protein